MRLKLLLAAVLLISAIAFAAAPLATFSDVTPQTAAHGFRATAVYLNDAGQPFGARFIHQKTGFTLDLIQIQSVPQAFTWTNTFPVSDKGEPHTQEHLLVGKGNKGRALAASESMTLTESSAFTMQRQTCYDFNTKAGLDVFYDEFRLQLDALLHPDYTDEEIRREVRNFGVSENPATHQFRLEEKGTVYNEMVSSMNQPAWPLLPPDRHRHLWRASSAGVQLGWRTFRVFASFCPPISGLSTPRITFWATWVPSSRCRKARAWIPNSGASIEILSAVQPAPVSLKPEKESDLPRPQPGPAGSIQIVDFPYENDQQPSYVALAWPADRKLSERDALLLNVFLDSFRGRRQHGSVSSLH